MSVVEKKRFGEIDSWMFGFFPRARPVTSVHVYLVDGLLIDTGQSRMRRHVLNALADRPIDRIVLTHHHEDHSGNAAALSLASGAPVSGHRLTAAKMEKKFSILPYQHLIWGSASPVAMTPLGPVVETDACRFRPIHTPGHSRDHTVYLEENRGWLFAGDLYLGERIKFFRSDERIREQIASLKKVLRFDFDALFCAHRPVPGGGRRRLENKLDFLDRVARLHDRGMEESEAVRTLDRGKDRWIRWLTMGNASFGHMVRSAYRDSARQDDTEASAHHSR